MLLVDSGSSPDARLNLAVEEHVFRQKPTDEDVLLFYVNAPSVIIGRNQNTIEEIAPHVVAERGIEVVRRISGGGAVYHDLGNLNFSFMTADVAGRFSRYDQFTRPVIDVLRDLGVPAVLGGRNDILVGGRKISGNAQFANGHRMFSHGTLLVHSNLDDVTAALQPRPGKVESKGIQSIRSRVANIQDFLAEPLSVAELRARISERIFGTRDPSDIQTLALDADDWQRVHELVARKYASWNWNYGENPACNVQRVHRFAVGEVDLRIDIRRGRISTIRIFGDFMGREDVSEIEDRLADLPYQRAAVTNALADLDLSAYFGTIAHEEFVNLVCP